MKTTIKISGKPVEIKLSPAAKSALEQSKEPLLAEMELDFSCLIRKQTRFRVDSASTDQVQVTDRLAVRFRPVMTQCCSVSEMTGDGPQLTDFELKRAAAFVPGWLHIDYQNNRWCGEFGYQGR